MFSLYILGGYHLSFQKLMADEKSLSGRILAILWYICAWYKCNFSAITYFQKSAVTIYVPYAPAPLLSAAFVIGARARSLSSRRRSVIVMCEGLHCLLIIKG